MRKIDLLQELSSADYEVALFTTFSVDLVFFEKMILRHLLDNHCTYIGLFIDQNRLREAVTRENIFELGRSYMVKGVEASVAFHPKVFLLLGERKAKLLVGSCNVTPAGFITNYEVVDKFLYEEADEKGDALAEIQAAFRFFESLHKKEDHPMWRELFLKTKEYAYLRKETTVESIFLSNEVQSLQKQVNSLLPERVSLIECFAPYFDQTLSVIDTWNEMYQPEHIHIYLQDGHSNFPRDIAYAANVSLFSATFLEKPGKRYHGKVFRFVGEKREVIVYGSGNCSRQAWLYPFLAGGNAEAMVVEEGDMGAFDWFFDENLTVKPLSIPLPEEFITLDLEDEGIEDGEVAPIRFVDGILENGQLVVTIQSTGKVTVERLQHLEEEGKLVRLKNNVYVFSFSGVEQLRPTFPLQGWMGEECFEFYGWYQDGELLQETFHNIKQSVHFKLADDPYLEDYQNMVELLDDLHSRLILTAEDLLASEKNNQLHRSIHQQAELEDTNTDVSGDIADYYVDESTIPASVYGAIGNVDVIGNLIRMLLRDFHDESATTSLGITPGQSETDSSQSGMATLEIPPETQEQLRNRMRRFRSKFREGITSERYMEQVDADVLVKNMVLYAEFLFKLENDPKMERILTRSELISDCLEMLEALLRYSESNILDVSREEMQQLLIQLLATITAKEQLVLETEDNYHKIRNEKKRLGLLLQNIHQQIHPVGREISLYAPHVVLFLNRRFQIEMSAVTYEDSFLSLFPLLTFAQFEEKMQNLDKAVLKQELDLNVPTVLLEREIRISYEFNFLQLHILNDMLAVEEWEEATLFTICWLNANVDAPLVRFELSYDREKQTMTKKYVYQKLEPLMERKENITVSGLREAAERGSARVIGEGFTRLRV